MNEWRKKHGLKDNIIVRLIDNQLQMIEKETCGMYQIYFYVNLFKPSENSTIINKKILKKRTIEKFLNEVLSTDRQVNENRIEQFTEESDIRRE